MIRLGTRGSTLALAQAGAVRERLLAGGGAEVDVVSMKTEGDRLAERRLAEVGGKGLFVREIEEALLAGQIDVAVHSLKDLPAEVPSGLVLAAYPEREDAGDVLVTRDGAGLDALWPGARLGTGSPRRKALALSLRPDLTIVPIRGNVETRLRKLADGHCDALILAAAGLRRLGLALEHARPLDPDVFVPAVGQGILGVEARANDGVTLRLLEAIDHGPTRARAIAERAYLGRLGASCVTPIAAHATLAGGGTLHMTAMVASEDGRQVLRAAADGPALEAEAIGRELAESLLGLGAASIVALAAIGGR